MIDHVIQNYEEMNTHVSIVENHISDHYIILTRMEYKSSKGDRTTVSKTWTRTDFDHLNELISTQPVIKETNGLNEKYDTFTLKLNEALKASTSRKIRVKRQKPNTEWVTAEL